MALGLFFVQRYRFLTIDQYARAAGLRRATASDQTRYLERLGLLSHFGNTGLAGCGKTPKAYFLTRRGWEILNRETDIPPELIGSYKETKVDARWSPQMFHRLRTVDLLISAEVAVRARSHLSMVRTFLEYRRVQRPGRHIERETTDYVAKEETAANRIVPDAAFIMENITTKKRGLFLVEMDMGTERIVSYITRDDTITLLWKLAQYDRYLASMRYRLKYQDYGDFNSFTLLFVTTSEARIANIQREAGKLGEGMGAYYRFATFQTAMGDFLGAIWRSRILTDTTFYPLAREA
jgi:hypothetical protein